MIFYSTNECLVFIKHHPNKKLLFDVEKDHRSLSLRQRCSYKSKIKNFLLKVSLRLG